VKDNAPTPELNRLLHEPARLRTLVQLAAVNKADFTWLLGQTGLSRGNLSVQMTKLADAGMVTIDKRFHNNRPQTLFALTASGRQALVDYKQNMQLILDGIPG
jgi:DNA-binding transcriptional ArsR family regulator